METSACLISRRGFLHATSTATAALAFAPTLLADGKKKPADSGRLNYVFVNHTAGKWADDQCFWSLDGGKEWHSFAKEPTTPCPTGNGRVYFRLGESPRNFDDRSAYWDFIEYAYGNGTWNGNTTQVDAFCIPLTISMGGKKVGIVESRAKLFEAFRKDCPAAFKDCVKGDFWIVSPARAGFRKGGPHGDYFDRYVDEIWNEYAREKPTPSGKYLGKVAAGALTFSPVGKGKSFTCDRKPTTQDILLGEGVLGRNPAFCAAFNRHVAADPADWNSPARFYQAEPCNWYSKFLHEHAIDHKCYGFCYDDSSEQAAFFSGKGDTLTVTLTW
ncbi:MAG TPA: beta-1,3-glucanase family protein [Tepidisphaeraceae bacterium]|jgi:hypothetical protein|nr:beta-1,3-glucanase family protein [Tepidisphaeraceae bacterium]